MRVFRDQDFEKMASRAVDAYLSGRSGLAEAVAKEAEDGAMNPDQIDRLVQSANTMTFLRMMDDRKQAGASDLMHEFDPVDARHVIRIVIDDAGVHVEPMEDPLGSQDGTSLDLENDLPDERGGLSPATPPAMNPAEGSPGHVDAPEVERCEEQCHEEHDPPGMTTKKKKPPGGEKEDAEPEAPVSPAKAASRLAGLRKLAGILEDQFRQAEWSFEDAFDRLCTRFRRAHDPPDFGEFEKDALAEHGDEVGISVMNALRGARGLPPLEATAAMEKVAAEAARHVSIDTPELSLFGDLVRIASEADRLRRGTALVRQKCA